MYFLSCYVWINSVILHVCTGPMGSKSRRRKKRKSVAAAARAREKKKKKLQKDEFQTPPPATPSSQFPASKSEWTREDCLRYFKNEPRLHPDLQRAGYKKERSAGGHWYFRSPGSNGKAGRLFKAGSARLKTKSIPRHLSAPANVLQEKGYIHPPALGERACKKVCI